MGSNDPVRLIGTDADIVALAVNARRVIAKNQEFARDLLPQVTRLASRRKHYVAQYLRPGPEIRAANAARRGRFVSLLWAWMLGAGLSAGFVSGALMAPPQSRWGRDHLHANPEFSFPIVAVATLAAIVLLTLAFVLRPVAGWVSAGLLCTVLTVAVVIYAIVFRAIVGSSAGVGYSPEQLRLWFIGSSIMLVVLGALSIQLYLASRKANPVGMIRVRSNRERQNEGQQLRDQAAILAKASPLASHAREALMARWDAALEKTTGIAPETIEQARMLGPVPWLVWVSYDGEIETTPVWR